MRDFPSENFSVAHKSDLAFLCLASFWKQDKISHAFFSLDESGILLPLYGCERRYSQLIL